MNIYKLLLRFYPCAWRVRYEEEFLIVLASHPFSLLEGIDVMRGALDAHLHPYLGTATMVPTEKIRQMCALLRGSLLTIFCAYVGFILAGLGFQKMTESADFQEITRTQSIVGLSFYLVVIGAVVALLAVLAGGLPIIVSMIRSALVRREVAPLLGLAMPFLAFVAFLGMLSLLKASFHPGSQYVPLGQVVLGRGLFFGSFIVAAIVSAGSICFAVTRSEISQKLLSFALPPSILATLSMALISVATLAWGLGLRDGAPQFFAGNNGIVGSSTIGTWLGIVLAMACATILALFSLIRGASAHSALRSTTV